MNFVDLAALNAAKVSKSTYELTRSQQDVLYSLLRLHRKHAKGVFPSMATLASLSDCSVRTAQRAVARFANLGLIKIQRRFKRFAGQVQQLTNMYRVTKCLTVLCKKKNTTYLSLGELKKRRNLIKISSQFSEIDRDIWLMYWSDTDPSARRTLDQWQKLFDGWIERCE